MVQARPVDRARSGPDVTPVYFAQPGPGVMPTYEAKPGLGVLPICEAKPGPGVTPIYNARPSAGVPETTPAQDATILIVLVIVALGIVIFPIWVARKDLHPRTWR